MSDVVLIAGMVFEHQVGSEWKRIPKITTQGVTGEQAEAKEKTTLEDTMKKYGSGLRDAPDKNLSGYYIPPQTEGSEYAEDRDLQQAFIQRCKDEEEFQMRVTFQDGESCEFAYKALGFHIDEGSQEDWKTFTVNGKQNSRVVWAQA